MSFLRWLWRAFWWDGGGDEEPEPVLSRCANTTTGRPYSKHLFRHGATCTRCGQENPRFKPAPNDGSAG